ncbi:FimV/HubP family polar landmark protein [Pulveribacter suum]|uniref:LysM domain-containing protein n=1 Tax=Pulveribacter suum TaxID=2116657 RepID=A0A2P1NJQ4_9BURK|nr:FimV/HubP family polar landmark protein [Pulveribacter suum]AVP57273.1 hypothetical protein C7H73_06040 [Pulveribacter suum]
MRRWKFSALATAAILSAGLYATEASALALGRLNVQSALGEPLRAEIDLPQITPAEAESLRVGPASPEVFRAQGMEYSSAAHTVRVQLQRRADGSMVLRLSSTQPINDPFVDLVIDANWSSGHIVRSYTMLLDPPSLRRPPAAVTAAPQVQAPRAQAPAAVVQRAERVPAAPAAAAAPVRAPAAAPAAASAEGGEVTVRPGDTAGRIAGAHRPSGVSLDQMLVALMRANPDAFVGGNVNRLRAGTVLQLPSQSDAQATAPAEARRIVAAQSRDFNQFRRRLADAAPAAQVATAERSASGKVQTQVEDKAPSGASPDKLTLSKNGANTAKADEQLARERQSDQNAARMAELSKNISELNQLGNAGTGAGAAGGAAATPQGAAPGVNVPAPASLPAPAASEAAPAAAPAAAEPVASAAEAAAPAASADLTAAAEGEASAPLEQASAPAPEPAPKPAPAPAAPPPPPYEEPSFLDSLTGDPLLAGGALAIVLLLLGYGGWRVVQKRRDNAPVDSSFMESRLTPDSFFGASGGQRVDTANSELATGSSSMTYSPSQLDAGGDVDPVAEADVYLAYGRDLQAEEILKEAQRHYPERVSIPAKLAEIYAKRQDHRALAAAAGDVLRLTNGQGPDWTRVADLGRTLDPDNALYQPGAHPGALGTGAAAAGAAAVGVAASSFASTLEQQDYRADPSPESVLPDLDLDLDLDLHEAPPAPSEPSTFAAAAAGMAAQPPAAAAPAASAAPELPAMDLTAPPLPGGTWDAAAPAPMEFTLPDSNSLPTEPSPLDLDDAGLSLMDSASAPLSADPAPVAPTLEFDLGDLSLDLGSSDGGETPTLAQPLGQAADALPEDPLATKLALAEEFNTIGDGEGARALVEEVIAESSGDLKARAQRLLAKLS